MTRVPPYLQYRFKSDDLFKCPSGHTYIRKEKRRGIFPQILEKILSKRRDVKKLVANAKSAGNTYKTMVYTSRELALKVVANSGYGFCGKPTSLYLWFVADSTTGIGREQITNTKLMVEEHFTIANGYPGNAMCVYGDTDSVMVDFGVTIDIPKGKRQVEDCSVCEGHPSGCSECRCGKVPRKEVLDAIQKVIDLSEEAGIYCTERFLPPNKLEFENVYWPYLLLNVKKRYAGPFWTNAVKPEKTKRRGLEAVRGDHPDISKETQSMILDYLLYRLDADAAVTEVRKAIKSLRTGDIDMSKLVGSRKLNAKYNTMPDKERKYFIKKNGRTAYKELCDSKGVYSNRQPHSELSHKLEKRSGKGYDLGERVPFVISRSTNKKARVCDRAEDPIYAIEKNVPIDITYYLTDLLKCAVNVLAPVYEHRLVATALSNERDYGKRLNEKPKIQRKLTDFFGPRKDGAIDSEAAEQPSAKRLKIADNKDVIMMKYNLPKGYEFGDFTKKMIMDHRDCRGVRLYKKVTYDDDDDGDGTEGDEKTVDGDAGLDTRKPQKRKKPMDSATRARRMMANYVRSERQCVGCKMRMGRDDTALICSNCAPNTTTIVRSHHAKYVEKKTACTSAWDKCVECQSKSVRGMVRDVADSSNAELNVPGYTPESCKEFTCDNFFYRLSVRQQLIDIEDMEHKLQKLHIDQ
jgi:hypothetical protein